MIGVPPEQLIRDGAGLREPAGSEVEVGEGEKEFRRIRLECEDARKLPLGLGGPVEAF